MAQWYSAEDETAQTRLLEAWPEAPLINLEVCEMLLEVAMDQVIAYARESDLLDAEGEPATDWPARLVYAQLQQAKNLWTAGQVTGDGSTGDEGFNFTPRPLDKTIRGIIRPVDGKPHVL